MVRVLVATLALVGCVSAMPEAQSESDPLVLQELVSTTGLVGTIRDMESWNGQLAVLTDLGVFVQSVDGAMQTVYNFDAPLGSHGGLLREADGALLVLSQSAVFRFETPNSEAVRVAVPALDLAFVRPEGLAADESRLAMFDAGSGQLWVQRGEEEPTLFTLASDQVALVWRGTELLVAQLSDENEGRLQAIGPTGEVRELAPDTALSGACAFLELNRDVHLIAGGSQYQLDGDQLRRVGPAGPCVSHLGTSGEAAYFTERGRHIDVYRADGWSRYPVTGEAETYFGAVRESGVTLATYFQVFESIQLNSEVATETIDFTTHEPSPAPEHVLMRSTPDADSTRWFEDENSWVGHQYDRVFSLPGDHSEQDWNPDSRVPHLSQNATWFVDEGVAHGAMSDGHRRFDIDFEFRRVFGTASGLLFQISAGSFAHLRPDRGEFWHSIRAERPFGSVRTVAETTNAFVVLSADGLSVLHLDGSVADLSSRVAVEPLAILDIAILNGWLTVLTEHTLFSLSVEGDEPANSFLLPAPYQRGTVTTRNGSVLMMTELGAFAFNPIDGSRWERKFGSSGTLRVSDLYCREACYILAGEQLFRADL